MLLTSASVASSIPGPRWTWLQGPKQPSSSSRAWRVSRWAGMPSAGQVFSRSSFSGKKADPVDHPVLAGVALHCICWGWLPTPPHAQQPGPSGNPTFRRAGPTMLRSAQGLGIEDMGSHPTVSLNHAGIKAASAKAAVHKRGTRAAGMGSSSLPWGGEGPLPQALTQESPAPAASPADIKLPWKMLPCSQSSVGWLQWGHSLWQRGFLLLALCPVSP